MAVIRATLKRCLLLVIGLGFAGLQAYALPVHQSQIEVDAADLSVITPPPSAPVDVAPDGFARLRGHVPGALTHAALQTNAAASDTPITITVVMQRDDVAGFEQYMKSVYDAGSPRHGHFLSQAQLTRRFGPSRQSYAEVARYLERSGLTITERSKNRLTVTATGPRRAVEGAFHVTIADYQRGGTESGRAVALPFYANAQNPALPRELAAHVVAIEGLSSAALVQPVYDKMKRNCWLMNTKTKQQLCLKEVELYKQLYCASPLALPAAGVGFDVAGAAGAAFGGASIGLGQWIFCSFNSIVDAFNALSRARTAAGTSAGPPTVTAKRAKMRGQIKAAATGTGQVVGLVEYDAFNQSDVADFLSLYGASAQLGNLSVVPVNGGVATPGAGESEVLLDIDTVMMLAPSAKVVVYEAPFDGHAASYSAMFNAMINGGVTIISNSWASCEDQMSQAEAQGIDTVLQAAAASGISVFNGTGDSGSTCVDGSANTVSVPADSPNATAVGGTSFSQGYGPGPSYGVETWWDGSAAETPTGQGGFGISKYFTRPSYQDGLVAGGMRSVPDVAIHADPADGVPICQADDGGCPSNSSYGGTSLAAPEWAALAALVNDAQGKKIGLFNTILYPLSGTDAFHSAASMGSDFAHVGLGSPNINVLNRLLAGATVGAPDPTQSEVAPLYSGAGTAVAADGSLSVPSDGSSAAGILVTMRDANGYTLSGKTITLTAAGGSAVITPASGVTSVANGAVAFTLTDLSAETVTLTATDTTDGVTLPAVTLTFSVPPAANAGVSANPSSVPADGASAASVTVTLTDSLSRPVPGKVISLQNGGSHAVIAGPSPSVTDGNGQIQFSATDVVNETVTFTAVDVSDGNAAVPGTPTVTFSGTTASTCGVNTPPAAGAGYSISSFVSGAPAAANLFYGGVNVGCPGANNPAFTSDGRVLVSDFYNGNIYQLGLNGGTVTAAEVLSNVGPALGTLVYGKDGSLYTTQGNGGGQIVQINPTTGAILRTVASGLTCPAGLSVDPLSGDLFFDDQCTGAGYDDATIYRVIDPSNSDMSRPTSVVPYATLPSTPNGGMAFSPDGTLYAVSGYYISSHLAPVIKVSGTNSSTVAVTPVPGVTSDYALNIGALNADGSARTLIVEPNGVLTEAVVADGSATVIASVSPGVGVVGPDGCLYSQKWDAVYRLAPASGTCTFTATSPAAALTLNPSSVKPGPAQGAAQTFTATLKKTGAPAGTAVYLQVYGVNPLSKLATSDSTGSATFTYTGQFTGADSVYAYAMVNGKTLFSNVVPVVWGAGQHLTFASLNRSAQSGFVSQPVAVTASLVDISTSPQSVLSGQPVTFTLGSSTCNATTDANGQASCSVTPAQAGSTQLKVQFSGNSTLQGDIETAPFSVAAPGVPAPTVSLTVSPTAIAAGATATLTWSSTNASACAASGSWSGAEATGGTQSVTPTANGSYSYTLTCSGDGGNASATAVLSATLATVTVQGKAGGGALSWPWVAALALLVATRSRRLSRVVLRGVGIVIVGMLLSSGTVRADVVDNVYLGVRVGSMPLHLDAGKLAAGLSARGYGDVTASTDTHAVGESFYVGYEIAPHADVEFTYTHRDADVARVSGTLAATADLQPLLADTTGLVRGYGNLFALSFRPRVEVAPSFMIDPRIGAFVWSTKVTASADGARIDATHSGGGWTAGLGASYRIWRGLEVGLGADYYRGTPQNVALLYAGTLEWRFGH